MLNKKQEANKAINPDEYLTRRQYFNYLRNTSTNMRNCLAWGQDQSPEQTKQNDDKRHILEPNNRKNDSEEPGKQKRSVSFDPKQNTDNNASKPKLNNSTLSNKKTDISPNNSFNAKQRSKSANNSNKKPNSADQDAKMRKMIRQNQLQIQDEQGEERRQKIQKYIEDLKPNSRSLPNSKYQDYFNRAAFQSYGRANVNNAIGGLVYGNHQKTFNMNPHMRGNQPQYYQTHTTTINYGKRAKLNEEDKRLRLERQITMKLGLRYKNQSLKQGKQVVYVDVDDSNMHSVMMENIKFKRQHDKQIKNQEQAYKDDRQRQSKTNVAEFFANKRDRHTSKNTIDAQQSTYTCDRDQKQRLHEQIIYRHTDKNGVVRVGADRHALTCFVDLNFPQNEAAYTNDLINQKTIYPVQVEEKDKYIDDQRRTNYQKSLENIYNSHYALPNSDQPEVINMINSKYGKNQRQSPYTNKGKNYMGSTFGTTGVANNSSRRAIGH